jgi:hypothetical protein
MNKKYLFYGLLILLLIIIIFYIIYTQIVEYYQQMDPVLNVIKDNLRPLNEYVESVQFYEGNKSYTINKKKIYLCLKDENNDYYDINMLMYVAIHELSHVMCDEIGHTPKFNKIFKENLERAEKLGIYDSSKPILSNYCGHF